MRPGNGQRPAAPDTSRPYRIGVTGGGSSMQRQTADNDAHTATESGQNCPPGDRQWTDPSMQRHASCTYIHTLHTLHTSCTSYTIYISDILYILFPLRTGFASHLWEGSCSFCIHTYMRQSHLYTERKVYSGYLAGEGHPKFHHRHRPFC